MFEILLYYNDWHARSNYAIIQIVSKILNIITIIIDNESGTNFVYQICVVVRFGL